MGEIARQCGSKCRPMTYNYVEAFHLKAQEALKTQLAVIALDHNDKPVDITGTDSGGKQSHIFQKSHHMFAMRDKGDSNVGYVREQLPWADS